MNETYSYKDYTGQDLSGISASEFAGTIKGSCFAQQWGVDDTISASGGKKIFPATITTTFENCNLDNVEIPAGATVLGGTNKVIKEQNDLEDWVMEDKGGWQAKELIETRRHVKYSLSTDPLDIPAEKVTDRETDKKDRGE
jgi:hypothetical protein